MLDLHDVAWEFSVRVVVAPAVVLILGLHAVACVLILDLVAAVWKCGVLKVCPGRPHA